MFLKTQAVASQRRWLWSEQKDTMQWTDRDKDWLEGSNWMAFFGDQYWSIKALTAMHIYVTSCGCIHAGANQEIKVTPLLHTSCGCHSLC